MADIARRLNISRATVSYVLNERENKSISDATRQRVLDVAREMGYRRNRAAQALVGQRSHLIELCVYGFYPAFYSFSLDTFAQQIAPTPYQLHIVKPNQSISPNWNNQDGGWPVDGIILLNAHLTSEVITRLKQRGRPIVNMGIFHVHEIDYVKVDLAPAVEEAMCHLAKHGRRIAYLSPWDMEKTVANPDPRFLTYRRIMKAQNLPEEVIVSPNLVGRDTRRATREIVRDYVTQNGCPDGILCFNDERAIAALAALRDLNLCVPDDVQIIGCDDIEEAEYQHPALTTVHYPTDEAVRLTWDFLQRRLSEPDIPLQSATLQAQIAWRGSTRH